MCTYPKSPARAKPRLPNRPPGRHLKAPKPIVRQAPAKPQPIVRQWPGNRPPIVRQSSANGPAMARQSSANRPPIVRQSSANRPPIARQSPANRLNARRSCPGCRSPRGWSLSLVARLLRLAFLNTPSPCLLPACSRPSRRSSPGSRPPRGCSLLLVARPKRNAFLTAPAPCPLLLLPSAISEEESRLSLAPGLAAIVSRPASPPRILHHPCPLHPAAMLPPLMLLSPCPHAVCPLPSCCFPPPRICHGKGQKYVQIVLNPKPPQYLVAAAPILRSRANFVALRTLDCRPTSR